MVALAANVFVVMRVDITIAIVKMATMDNTLVFVIISSTYRRYSLYEIS